VINKNRSDLEGSQYNLQSVLEGREHHREYNCVEGEEGY
jgi:hypothetical protein